MNTKILAGSRFRVDNDYSFEVWNMRCELVPYLRDAKSRGHRAFIRGDG
jgi:hypothetical protein